jgi:hypothetical protein
MTKRLLVVACALFVMAAPLSGQASDNDHFGWFGLMMTPVGAFPQIELPSGGTVDRRTQFAIRLASWKYEAQDDRNSALGLTFFSPMGTKARFGATLGWFDPGGPGDGTIMAGADLGAPIWASATTEPTAVSIDVAGSLGIGRFTGSGGGTAWSLAGHVPFKIRHTFASKSMVSGFVRLGYGVAGVSDGGDAENGSRPLIGFGGAWGFAGGAAVHLGAQQVMIDGDPPWVGTLAITFPFGSM